MRAPLICLLSAATLFAGAALAQSPSGSATPAGGAADAGASATAPRARHAREPNAARDACRTQVDAQALTGDGRKQAMRDCMKPKVEACRQQASTQGMPAKSGERRDFVRHCLQTGA